MMGLISPNRPIDVEPKDMRHLDVLGYGKALLTPPEKPSHFRVMNWFAWSLLSAIFAALTAVLAKIGVADLNANLATAVRTSVVLGFVWIVALATNPSSAIFSISSRTWAFLALSGIATGLSWLCYFHALQVGPASKVAPVDKLSVVFVLIFAALFLREPLSWKAIAGGGLITSGAILLAWA
jgi:transporter family protein